jgi:hypothetical protein
MANIAAIPHYFSPILYFVLLAIPGMFLSGDYTALVLKAQADYMFDHYGVTTDLAGLLTQVDASGVARLTSQITQLVVTPLTQVASGAVGALVVFVLCKIFRGKAKYAQIFSMTLHIAVINMVYLLLVYFLSGVTQTTLDYTSLASLFVSRPDLASPAYTMLSYVSLFTLWAAALQWVGIKVLNEFSWARAGAVTAVSFLLGLLTAGGSALITRFSYEMTGGILSGAGSIGGF